MELMDVIRARRAYRSLAPAALGEEQARALAEAAALSPSCFNKQPWRFVFAYEQAVLEKLLAAMNKGNEWTRAASMIVAVCSRRDLDCVVKGREYYLFDSGLAAAFLILRATEMGLVAHPIAGYDEDAARAALGIPGDMTLITLVVVGRHVLPPGELLSGQQKEIEKSRPQRLPLGEIMRLNRF